MRLSHELSFDFNSYSFELRDCLTIMSQDFGLVPRRWWNLSFPLRVVRII